MDIEPAKLEERIRRLEQSLAHSQGQRFAQASDSPATAGSWLTSIAIICFIGAAAVLIRLAMETGWLTPERQMGLAALIGLGLAGAGLAFGNTQNPHVNLLPGAGINILFLTSFAAHRLYGLIPGEIAVAITSVFSGICLWLYTELEQDLYAVTAAFGAFVIPIVFEFGVQSETALAYYVLCSLAFAAISIWMKSRVLTLISSYLAIIATSYIGILSDSQMSPVSSLTTATALGIHFIIFTSAAYLSTMRTGVPLTEREGLSFLPVLLVFYGMEFYFIDQMKPGLGSIAAISGSVVLTALYFVAKRTMRDQSLGSLTVILIFITLTLVHAVHIEMLPSSIRPWALPIGLLLIAFRKQLPVSVRFEGPMRIPIIGLLAILTMEFLGLTFHMITEFLAKNRGEIALFHWSKQATLTIATLAGIMILSPGSDRRWRYVLVGSFHMLAAIFLARFTPLNAVWMSWATYAAATMAYGYVRKDKLIQRSAWFLAFLAIGKLLLIDAPAFSGS